MTDFPAPPRPSHRMTVPTGRWHEVAPNLSVMVLAVPRGRVAAYGLVFFGSVGLPERSRFDWETLVNWSLAQPTKPPASVTPLTAAKTPSPK